MTERLFHFTCDHGYRVLGKRGLLEPQITHPFLHCRVIWLTTEPSPDPEMTGLSHHYTKCDRMAYRYIVSGPALELCEPWLGSPQRDKAPEGALADLESYGDPEHWWITEGPTPARLG